MKAFSRAVARLIAKILEPKLYEVWLNSCINSVFESPQANEIQIKTSLQLSAKVLVRDRRFEERFQFILAGICFLFVLISFHQQLPSFSEPAELRHLFLAICLLPLIGAVLLLGKIRYPFSAQHPRFYLLLNFMPALV